MDKSEGILWYIILVCTGDYEATSMKTRTQLSLKIYLLTNICHFNENPKNQTIKNQIKKSKFHLQDFNVS